MPFDKTAVPTRLIESVARGNFVPLIGAGLSKQASGKLPNWVELLMSMADEAQRRGYIDKPERDEVTRLLDRDKYLMVAEELRNRFPTDEYETILENWFSPKHLKPAKVHEELYKFGVPLLLTTNYDRLLEDAYAHKYRQNAMVKTYFDTPSAQRYFQSGKGHDRPLIFKIHGTIDDPKSIVLSEQDYRDLIYQQSGYRLFLSAVFVTQVILMLGFSLSDPELMLLLENLRESLKHRSHPDYIFLPDASAGSVEKKRLRDDFGVEIIPYTPTKGHPEVLELLKYLLKESKKAAATATPTP